MSTVQISPRLLPGVRIGDAWVSMEPLSKPSRDGRAQWRIYIDAEGREYESPPGDELRSGCGQNPPASEMLESCLGFLEACAESVAYARRSGRAGENAELFPKWVGEWADANKDEITMVRLELEEGV
jgi:hypothetical protein